MPPLNETVNATITRIDAPFPDQWREPLGEFTKEISEIKSLLGAIATSLTSSTEAQQAVLNLYKNESVAERASQAIAQEQSQQRLLDAQGRPLEASSPQEVPTREEEQRNEEKQQPSTPPDAERLLDKEVTMPQHYGGKYTTQDLLILAGKLAQWNKPGGVGEQPELATGLETWAKRVPNAEATMNLAKTYIGGTISNARARSQGFEQYAGSLGFEAGEGFLGSNSVSGPFGTNFRVPLINSGALSGIGSTIGSYEQALSVPGLSGSQAMAMKQSLAERGWYPGQEGAQELFDSQAHLIGKGGVVQQLGESPEVAELLDKAMRSGNASSEEMIRTIEEIPDAAKNAHEGIESMVTSMNEFGEFSQSQGGTHYAGQQQALQLANMTGLPNGAVKGLMESPWAQSAIFRETGMPSWMQGTVPGSIKNQAAMHSFWSLASAVGKGEGRTYKSGGFEEHVSPIEEQAARMHMIMPDVPPETIQRMLREGKRGAEGRNEVQKQAEMWRKSANELVEQGDIGDAGQILTANNVGKHNFGRLMKNMEEQRTENGKKMFSREDIQMIRNNWNQGYSGHGKQLVEERYKALQKVLGSKAGKDANAAGSPGKVVIELSPGTKKLLQFSNKRSRIKIEAGAGENSTVNGFSGYSDGLIPTSEYNPVYDGGLEE